MSGHSLSERSTNDELRQISDTGAPARSRDNPPSLRCNLSRGGTPQSAAHRRCLASPWLMHSSVLFLFVLMTSASLVRILWLFANTADASAYTCHFFLSRFARAQNPESFDMISLSGNHTTSSPPEIQEVRTLRKWVAIKSQRVGVCCLWLIRLLFSIMPKTAEIHSISSICLLCTVTRWFAFAVKSYLLLITN